MATRRFAIALLVLLLCVGCSKPNGRPHLLAFTASWCGPCHLDQPKVAALKADGLAVKIVDVDREPEKAKRFHVNTIPQYFLFDGQRHCIYSGGNIESVRKLVDSCGR
jgi:thiol-disulfide isomerase/thioredoxin